MSLLLRSLPLISLRSFPPFPSIFTPQLSKPLFKPTRILFFSSAASSSSSPPPTAAEAPLAPQLNSLQWVSRTGFCGELSADDVGRRVRLCGWVALHRVHGALTFLNLRDHTGIVQVTTLPDEFPDAHSIVNDLRLEYVIAVDGLVRSRPSESVNKKMKTGVIEVAAEHVQILNAVKSKLPFLVTTADDAKDSIKEEIRLRFRCLDLRRQQMNFNMMLRHRVVKLIRRYLEDTHGFVEVD